MRVIASRLLTALAGLAVVANVWAADENLKSLTQALSGPDASQRIRAAQQLGEMGAAARDAVPQLVKTFADGDLAVAHEAIQAVGHIGPAASEAVPALTRLITAQASPILRHSAIDALRRIGAAARPAAAKLKESLRAPEPFVRVAAAHALAELAPEDSATQVQVLDLLIAALGDANDELQGEAVAALAARGASAVPALVKVASGRDETARRQACAALAAIGPAGRAASGDLRTLLGAKDALTRSHAAHALGEIHADPQQDLPALEKLLKDDTASVRAHATGAIGQYAATAQPAVPALIAALADRDEHVRLAAARALGSIGPGAAAAVPALAKALDDPLGSVTLEAADALGHIGAASLPAIIARLQDQNMQPIMIMVIGQLGPEAKDAVPALIKLLDSSDDPIRREVMLALGSIGPGANAAVDKLLAMLQNQQAKLRPGAAYALARIGAVQAVPTLKQTVKETGDRLLAMSSAWALVTLEPQNAEFVAIALPQLISGLTHELALVRTEAANALGRIGPRADAAVPALVKAARDPDPTVRLAAIGALGEMGPVAAKDAAPVLSVLIDHTDPDLRRSAADAVGRMGASARGAIPALQQMQTLNDPIDRSMATIALVRIDPQPAAVAAALPHLTAALQSPYAGERLEAAALLGQLGHKAASAKPALEQATKDADEQVRKAASEALRQVQ